MTASPATSRTSAAAARPGSIDETNPRRPLPGRSGRQGRAHRSRRLLCQPEGRPGGECRRDRRADRPRRPGRRGQLLQRRRRHFVPTMVIQQSLSSAIKAQLAIPAVGQRQRLRRRQRPARSAAWSARPSRGPSSPTNSIKPEIGAPGASVSAIAGSGTGTEAFGGTSGATPMVAGAAALIKAKYPTRTVREIKSLLMNTAETTIYQQRGQHARLSRPDHPDRRRRSPGRPRHQFTGGRLGPTGPGPAPSRSASSMPGEPRPPSPASSRSATTAPRRSRYAIKPTFRYSDDRLLGAIKFTAPATITIPARSARSFTVKMTINGAKLREWTLDSGANALAARVLDTARVRRLSQPRQHQDLERQRRSAAPGLARPAAPVGQRLGPGRPPTSTRPIPDGVPRQACRPRTSP